MKKIILATAVIALAGAGISLMAATQAKNPTIKEPIVQVISIKNALNRYITDIIKNNILNTPETQANAFTMEHGPLQTKNVIESYYKAAWKEHDAHEKLILKDGMRLTTNQKIIQAATGLTLEQIEKQTQKNRPTAINLNLSLNFVLKVMSIQGLAAILLGIPYLMFINLGIPAITMKPILIAAEWTSGFTKKAIYNSQKYTALRPLFDRINKRIINDWKIWNVDTDIQTKWIGKTIVE